MGWACTCTAAKGSRPDGIPFAAIARRWAAEHGKHELTWIFRSRDNVDRYRLEYAGQHGPGVVDGELSLETLRLRLSLSECAMNQAALAGSFNISKRSTSYANDLPSVCRTAQTKERCPNSAPTPSNPAPLGATQSNCEPRNVLLDRTLSNSLTLLPT